MQHQSVISVNLADYSSQEFALFLKVREVKAALQTLQMIALLSKEQKQEWVKEYGELVYDAIDNLIDHSGIISIDGFSPDDSSVQLSQELIRSLRDMVSTIQSIMYTETQGKQETH